jgi:twitching motility protein PilT
MNPGWLDKLLVAAGGYGASDLHLIAGVPAAFRINGEIILADGDALSAKEISGMACSLMNELQREQFEREWELCISLHHPAVGRIRATFYRRGGHTELSLRFCGDRIGTREELGCGQSWTTWLVNQMACFDYRAYGAGKTTTLNYMVDSINSERRCKIITIEDPIEYVHRTNAPSWCSRRLTDTHSFNRALVHGLRQDPDVIVVGEVRDHEAIGTALKAAETGHLVLATLHSPSVALALERIIGVFEGSAQCQIVLQLANALQGIIAQELLPAVDRSRRVLAYELLVANGAVRNLVRENNLHHLENCIQTGARDGMVLMDSSLHDLYSKCQISYDTALSRARNPDRIAKGTG